MGNMPSTFDWLAFFFGGAFGSLIILGIERLWDWNTERIKSQKEESQITKALETEIQSNIDMCNQMVATIEQNPTTVTFAKFEYLWSQMYSNKYIDFTSEDSVRLYSFLFGIRKSADTIHDLQSNLQMFSATSRALGGYTDMVVSMNQNIKQNVQRLKAILEEVKNRRKDNKMFNNTTASNT